MPKEKLWRAKMLIRVPPHTVLFTPHIRKYISCDICRYIYAHTCPGSSTVSVCTYVLLRFL